MPALPPEQATTGTIADRESADGASQPRPRVASGELTNWLHERVPHLQERWLHEIRARGLGQSPAVERVVEMFVTEIVYLLPFVMGRYRDQMQPLWDCVSELFGSIAAKRGLAAGEAIEEIHILRELVIRDLYRDPPLGGKVPLSLREILRLSRALDRCVTHASVGHTDAMFFQFFGGEEAVDAVNGVDVAAEAEAQLEMVRSQVQEILEHATSSTDARGRKN